MPLIYKEKIEKNGKVKGGSFKIILFDFKKAYKSVRKIEYIKPGSQGRKHPIYGFFNSNNQYIFEIRYGGPSANALQRGLWTHTENAEFYFNKILNGFYVINQPLLKLISKLLVSSKEKHKEVFKKFFKQTRNK